MNALDIIALGSFVILAISWVVLPLKTPAATTPVELEKAA